MSTLSILTLSYRPDLPGFARLHDSVLRHTSNDVVHQVVVPEADVAEFRDLQRPSTAGRLRVSSESEFLPTRFVRTDLLAQLVAQLDFLPAKARIKAINRDRPWPPIRGWILQQVLKLAAAAAADADVVAVIDSDVELIAPVDASTFMRDGVVRAYRSPGAITEGLDRHVMWSHTARELLGLPRSSPPFADYIAGLITWDPEVVRSCTGRIEQVSDGVAWPTVVASLMHFSEFILYGTFLEQFGTQKQNSFVSDDTLCHSYWGTTPLSMDGAREFLAALEPTDVAVHIQSASGTSEDVRAFVLGSIPRG